MSLHVSESGEGQPLCLLHGWALNSRVWDPVVNELQQSNRVMAIDLPGHGKSAAPADGEYTVDSLAEIISQQLKPGTILAGWSLGGMVSIKIAAKYPELVKKLILIASSPQFANSDSWEYGIKKSIIDSFANDLTTNYRETIHRFLAIQMFGSDNAKLIIRDLREKVFANGEPHIESLSKGLQILKSCDLWEDASQIKCPTVVILGEKDTLIPEASGERTRQTIQQCELKIIKGAGHGPFISHPKEFLKIVNNFIND